MGESLESDHHQPRLNHGRKTSAKDALANRKGKCPILLITPFFQLDIESKVPFKKLHEYLIWKIVCSPNHYQNPCFSLCSHPNDHIANKHFPSASQI